MIFYLMLLITWILVIREFDLYLDRRKPRSVIVTITDDYIIAEAYAYMKNLVEREGFTVAELKEIVKNNISFGDEPTRVGVMKYLNECPVEKFNQISANNQLDDPMTQKVEI